MENNETNSEIEGTGTSGRLAFIVYCLLIVFIPGILISPKDDAFRKEVAQEYGLPLSVIYEMIGYYIPYDIKFLPYPHRVWYVTLENGTDVPLGTAYFGIVSLNENNIDTYFPLRDLRRELGAHDFPFSLYE